MESDDSSDDPSPIPDGRPSARVRTDGGDDSGGFADEDGAGGDRPSVGDVVGGSPSAFRERAADFLDFWGDSHDLDFSPESLTRLDDVLSSQQERANYLEVTLDGGDAVVFAPIANGAACYFGEVLVRTLDGEWKRSDGRWGVEVAGPETSAFVGVFHVAHDCLEEDPKFDAVYETVTRTLEIE